MNRKIFYDKGLIFRQVFFMVLDVGAVIVSAIGALLLRFNLSFKEIGEIMGKSENWARVTFYRGKERLKKGMVEQDE